MSDLELTVGRQAPVDGLVPVTLPYGRAQV